MAERLARQRFGICPVCHREFSKMGFQWRRRYCSAKCQKAAWHKRQKAERACARANGRSSS